MSQVEMNPAWHQVKLRGFCKEKGIHVTAWSPLGANGAFWGSLAVVDNPILKEISTAKGKSLAQVECYSSLNHNTLIAFGYVWKNDFKMAGPTIQMFHSLGD